jgi:hypothetical protein
VNTIHEVLDCFKPSRGVIVSHRVLIYYAIEIDSPLFFSGSFGVCRGSFSGMSLPESFMIFQDVLRDVIRVFLEVVEVDLTIGLIHDSYRRWERGRRFLKVVEVDLTIGLVHDSYHRWERGRRFLLWMKISCCLVRASCALLIELE